MKLLHTSDWHLGQTLHEHERVYEHQCFLDWLLQQLLAEKPDVLLIAGDVFDSVNPPVSAQRQLYAFVADAVRAQPHLQIIVIAGNHDSSARIELPAPLMQAFGVRVIGRVSRSIDGALDTERLRIGIRDAAGAVIGEVLALPFLRAADVSQNDDSYSAGIARTHADLIAAAVAGRVPGTPLIAISHAHMQGGSLSPDSERKIIIGNAEAIPASAFPAEIAYVALGHLHLAQRVGAQERMRYCGSPIPLSFSERDYPHQVLVAEFAGEALRQVRGLPIPRAVSMQRIRGDLSAVLAELAQLQAPALPRERQPWIEVRVQLAQPLVDLAQQIDAALAAKSVRLLGPIAEYANAPNDSAPALVNLDQIDPALLFARAWERKWGSAPSDSVMLDFAQLMTEAEESE